MNLNEHLLTCLAEECGEVAKECHKALRFGLQDRYPHPNSSPTNLDKIVAELNDIFALIEILTALEILPGTTLDRAKIQAKKDKVEKFLEYARQCHTLDD